MFETLIREWDGEFVATRFDAASGAWMFVGVHSTALGPGFGGTRMKVYDAPEESLGDVLRLSAAMTFKNAMADLPFGGGKSVLAVPAIPQGDERTSLLERYADFVGSLGGSYVTACDMNTTEADMDVVGERCPHVMGRSVGAGGSGTSAPDTAIGVFHGIRAGLAHTFGSDDPSGRTIVVEGAGAVGGPLCDLLADAGAKLVVSDIDPDKARAVAERVGADVVDPLAAFDVPCDLFSPCATGAVLNADTIPRLRCRVVAGAANNQLADDGIAALLHRRGILWAPDFVANAGGIINIAVELEPTGYDPKVARGRVREIGDTLRAIFDAAAGGVTPLAAALELARQRLAEPDA